MAELNQCRVVLLEADSSRRDFLKSAFLRWGLIPFVFEKESICLDNLASLNPDLVISGNCTSDNTIRFVNSLKMMRHSLPVLLLSDDKSVKECINTSGLTGIGVCRKNTSINDFRCAVLQALDPKDYKGSAGNRPLIVGSSPEVLRIKRLIPKIGQSNEAVIIEGEPGTGKELLARAIHGHSIRSDKPFIKINAIKLPYQLLDGEIFGYPNFESGNLSRQKNGVLAVADSSTFFIKEIAAIPGWMQAKIAGLLEDGYYPNDPQERNERAAADIRIIASTTRNLSGLVKKGLFREDLFYRLNALKMRVPPLRDRIADIAALADFFVCKHCYQFDKSCYQISPSTISGFCKYHWPGNLNELKNIVEQIILSGQEKNVVQSLSGAKAKRNLRPCYLPHLNIDNSNELVDVKSFLHETKTFALKSIRQKYKTTIEKNLVHKALESTGGNQKKAAEILGISYKSLLNKMKSYRSDKE